MHRELLAVDYREWGEPLRCAPIRSGWRRKVAARTVFISGTGPHVYTAAPGSAAATSVPISVGTQLVVGSDGYPAAGILLDLVQEWHSCPSSSEIIQTPRDCAAVTALHHGKYRSDPDSARNKRYDGAVTKGNAFRGLVRRQPFRVSATRVSRGSHPRPRRSAGRRSDTRSSRRGLRTTNTVVAFPRGE